MRPTRLALSLATTLACTFDATGIASTPESSSDPGTTGTTGAPSTTDPLPTTATTTPDPDPTTTTLDPTSTTAVDPTATTVGPTTDVSGCGDGVLDVGEDCDGAELGGQTCADFGLEGDGLVCTPDCTLDPGACTAPETCGDLVVQEGEACDGGVTPDQTCEGLGFDGGALACAANCVFDTGACFDAPADWYDLDFLKRRRLTIPADGVHADLEDFPVVVVATDAALVASLAPADKLVFTTLGGDVLRHELEFDAADRLVVWVKLPDLADRADTEFYVYYGNPAVGPTEDPAGTWDDGFLAVWHLDEDVPDEQEGGQHVDATGSGHTGIQHDNQTANPGDCRIARCQILGGDDWIEIDKDADFKIGNANVTIQAWVLTFQANIAARSIFGKAKPDIAEDGHLIFGMQAPALGNRLLVEQFGVGQLPGTTDIANNTWHHVVFTQKKDNQGPMKDRWTIYLDGEVEAEMDFDAKAVKDPQLARIGAPTPGSTFPANLQGRVDEVQVSLVHRSAGWVRTAYENQSAPAMFTLFGPEETL